MTQQELQQLLAAEPKVSLLLTTILQYEQTGATGAIIIDFSKGKMGHIDTKVRITANSA